MADDNKLVKNHFLSGVKFCAQGRHAEAVKAFEQVEREDRNFKQAQTNLKWISFCKSTLHDEFISDDQNRWQPGKKKLSRGLLKRF